MLAALLLAIVVMLAWGALSDAASAQSEDEDATEPAPAVEATEQSSPAADAEPTAEVPEAAVTVEPEATTVAPSSDSEPPAEVDEGRTTTRSRRIAAAQAEDASSPESSDEASLAAAESAPVVMALAVEEDAPITAAATPAPAVSQCNPGSSTPFPGTTAGHEVTCTVTVENTLSPTGAKSSTVTTTECLAAAGVTPTILPTSCTTAVQTSPTEHVTSVNQCNGTATGGGSNITCRVNVINNVPVGTASPGVTTNQCIGSGLGGGGTPNAFDPATQCAPIQSTTGATVDQCNGSGNGGGAPLRVKCTVAGATSALPVTVDQCEGSGNGGGSTVTCSVSYTNNFIVALPDDTPPVVIPPVVIPPVVIPPVDTPPGGGGDTPPGGGGDTPPGGGDTPSGGGDTPPGSGTANPDAAPGNGAAAGNVPLVELPAPVLVASSTPVGAERARRGSATTASSNNAVMNADGTSVLGARLLASTGSMTSAMALTGLLAIMLGGLLVLIARRPRRTASTI